MQWESSELIKFCFSLRVPNVLSKRVASEIEIQRQKKLFRAKGGDTTRQIYDLPLNHYFTEFAASCLTAMHVFGRAIRELYIILKDVKRLCNAYRMNIMHKVFLENVTR